MNCNTRYGLVTLGLTAAVVLLCGPAAAAGPAGGDELSGKLASAGIIAQFFILYGFGVLLAFTPCVYPMIPVTVGYFASQSREGKRSIVWQALAYVLGLAITYSVLGTIAALGGGVFGAAMQSAYVQMGIALMLVVLALSMFGLYEIHPPASIAKRSVGRSGVLGALLMGLIFGIVAAPCVGPAVLGLLAHVAQIGRPEIGFILFFALSLGIGTPLFFLAAFSAKMPAPGAWMVAVKKAAGFLMLGAAAYFLRPILPEVLKVALVPLVILVGGVYLGFFEKSVRTSPRTTTLFRIGGVILVILAISMATPTKQRPSLTFEPYSDALAIAAMEAGKPVMIDFTAEWCTYCKKLERGPMRDERVVEAAQDFVRLKVDGTDQNDETMLEMVSRHGVRGFPAIIFLDKNGSEIREARIEGYVEADILLASIEEAAGK